MTTTHHPFTQPAEDGRVVFRTASMSLSFVRRCALLVSLLALAACGSLPVSALLGDEVSFSQAQLQQSLDRNFPKKYERLGGLLEVKLMRPRLTIPQGGNRLRMEVDIDVDGLGRMEQPDGTLALTSGLRFDPATRGLHLDAPSIERLDMPAFGGAMGSGVREFVNSWLVDYARDEPVHRFDGNLIERLGARRIDATRIADGRVTLELGN